MKDPCKNCCERQWYARRLDIYFSGDDCPYICKEYARYKAEKETDKQKEEDRCLDSLKPCPFCGGKAERRFHTESVESPFECIITCADCGANLKVVDTANDLKTTQNLAIDKWNARI